MRVAIAELEAVFQKTGMALGLGIGLGLEAGRGALAMYGAGIDPLPDYAVAFDAFADETSCGAVLGDDREYQIVPKDPVRAVSAIVAAPTICDLIDVGETRIHVESVDCPLIVLATLLARGIPATVERTDSKIVTAVRPPNGLCFGDNAVEDFRDAGHLLITPDAPPEIVTCIPVTGGLDVDECAWSRLLHHAGKCLVSGSEQSRLNEAGAGLVDVD